MRASRRWRQWRAVWWRPPEKVGGWRMRGQWAKWFQQVAGWLAWRLVGFQSNLVGICAVLERRSCLSCLHSWACGMTWFRFRWPSVCPGTAWKESLFTSSFSLNHSFRQNSLAEATMSFFSLSGATWDEPHPGFNPRNAHCYETAFGRSHTGDRFLGLRTCAR